MVDGDGDEIGPGGGQAGLDGQAAGGLGVGTLSLEIACRVVAIVRWSVTRRTRLRRDSGGGGVARGRRRVGLRGEVWRCRFTPVHRWMAELPGGLAQRRCRAAWKAASRAVASAFDIIATAEQFRDDRLFAAGSGIRGAAVQQALRQSTWYMVCTKPEATDRWATAAWLSAATVRRHVPETPRFQPGPARRAGGPSRRVAHHGRCGCRIQAAPDRRRHRAQGRSC